MVVPFGKWGAAVVRRARCNHSAFRRFDALRTCARGQGAEQVE